MKWNKIFALLMFCLTAPFVALAQHGMETANNKMDVVHYVLIIIFSGLAVLLFWIDMRLRKVEKHAKK